MNAIADRPAREIIARVNKQDLSLSVPEGLVSDSIGYVRIRCTFDSDWLGLDKWVHLEAPDGHIPDPIELQSDRTRALSLAPGWWRIRIHGSGKEGGKRGFRITTCSQKFYVKDFGTLHGNGPLPDLEPTVSEQVAASSAYTRREVERLKSRLEGVEGTAAKIGLYAEQTKEASKNAEKASGEAEEHSRKAESAKNTAVWASMHNPIIENGTWYVWDTAAGEYVNTGVAATAGKTEVDPTLSVKGAAADALAVGQALERCGAKEADWELIEEAVTSVDGGFERTAEPDGAPYHFKKALVTMKFPAMARAVRNVTFRYGGSVLGGGYISEGTKQKDNTYAFVLCYAENGKWTALWTNRYAISPYYYQNITRDSYNQMMNRSHPQYPEINRLVLESPPVGTTIQIWGVRA